MKTWGRELAVVSLAFWLGLTVWYFGLDTSHIVSAYAPSYSTTTLSIWGFVMAMFGVDKVVKYKGK